MKHIAVPILLSGTAQRAYCGVPMSWSCDGPMCAVCGAYVAEVAL